ncbi:MAG: type II toxin-antitoxin system PemK/MazF family toxin [Pseudomonadota bacterium]|nr:type II toxin-antitoxin system PemK/MazF family toxin [Pseudomonadota bacterium]
MATKDKLILLPFPFDDFQAAKLRPALCLTDPIGPYRHVIVAFISRAVAVGWAKRSVPNIAAVVGHATLCPTYGLLHRLLTVPESLFQRELGMLPSTLRGSISDKLRTLFQLPI